MSVSTGTKILAVASGGGHWVQLLRLRPAFEGAAVTYVTTMPSYRPQVDGSAFHVVPDASRWNKVRLGFMALKILWIVAKVRPQVVISTGAAPGYFALKLGKLFGARTLWLDSIANVEELSLSGKRAGPSADLWLTQWPHLAEPGGPQFVGAVI